MELLLTEKYKHSVRGKDGKRKNWMVFCINGVELFRQKCPFNEFAEHGWQGKWRYENIYIHNGKLFQTRYGTTYDNNSSEWIRFSERRVSYPLSKKKLEALKVPSDLKIELDKLYILN